MAIGIDVGPSSAFMQKKITAQVQPLQLCLGGVLFAAVIFIFCVFGITYETDSLVMLEHDLEMANSTATHLGSAHNSLERRLQSTERHTRYQLKHRDSELHELKEKAETCELSLKTCKGKVKDEALQIEDEKEMESELEKRISDHMIRISQMQKKHDMYTKESADANYTVKRLHDELFQVKQTHKAEMKQLEEEHKGIQYRHGSAIFSLRLELKQKMAQKQWLRIYIAVIVCMWIFPMSAYLFLTSGKWSSLRFSAKRFMEP